MRPQTLGLAALSLALVGVGCSPVLTGAPCALDSDCPSGQFCNAQVCSTTAGPADSGGQDAGPTDAGPSDAGPTDAGPSDAGPADAGAVDAGAVDAGMADGGAEDAGSTDGGELDGGGQLDAGPSDAGVSDAGAPDSGEPDSGSVDGGKCPAMGNTAGSSCLTLGASMCDPTAGKSASLLTCDYKLLLGCQEWDSADCPFFGLTCGPVDGGSACICPAATSSEIWVDPDGGSDEGAGVKPTGLKTPVACRFKTLTDGLAAVPDGGMVVATGSPKVPPTWVADLSYSNGALVSPNLPNAHQYLAEQAGVSGDTEPTWPVDGGSVADGTLRWKDNGFSDPFVFAAEKYPLVIPGNTFLYSDGCQPSPSSGTSCQPQAWIIALTNDNHSLVLGPDAGMEGFMVVLASGSAKAPPTAISCASGSASLQADLLLGNNLLNGGTGQIGTGISVSGTCSLNANAVLVESFGTGITIDALTSTMSLSNLFLLGNTFDGLDVHSVANLSLLTSNILSNGGSGVYLIGDQGAITADLEENTVAYNAGYGVQIGGPASSGGISESLNINDVYLNGSGVSPAAGLYFDASSTLASFDTNTVHSNSGTQVYFAASPAGALSSWPAGPTAGCGQNSNSFYCYDSDGGTGMFAAFGVTVDANNDTWANAPPAAKTDDFSGLGITASESCPAAKASCP